MKNKIYIIGAGKVGSAFAFELKDKGYRIQFLTDRNSEDLKIISSSINPLSFSAGIEKEFIAGSDIIIICVQDRYLRGVIDKIGSLNAGISDKIFYAYIGLGFYGVFPQEIFNDKNLVSFHPIQTFDKVSFKNNTLLKNIYFGIEGGSEGKNIASADRKRS